MSKQIRISLILHPLTLSVIFYLFHFFIYFFNGINSCNGNIVFMLDDPYIHLSIVDTLLKNGVWGVNGQEFSSASSSFFYVLIEFLIAKIFNISSENLILIPIILANIFNILIILFMFKVLNNFHFKNFSKTLILMGISILIPLPLHVLNGMEHSIQIFFSILFFDKAIKFLSSLKNDKILEKHNLYNSSNSISPQTKVALNKKIRNQILIITLLLTSIRIEGFLLIGAFILILLYKRKMSLLIFVLELACISIIPIFVFGLYSFLNGGTFIPSSILTKVFGTIVTEQNILKRFLGLGVFLDFVHNPFLSIATFLLIQLILLFYFEKIKINEINYSIILFLLAFFFHAEFSTFGAFYRYEAYLLAILIYILIELAIPIKLLFQSNLSEEKNGAVKEEERNKENKYFRKKLSNISKNNNRIKQISYIQKRWAAKGLDFSKNDVKTSIQASFVMIIIILTSISILSIKINYNMIYASKNIYEQQYQMANFLKIYYDNKSIAANDIGAINFYTNCYILDLIGLSNKDVSNFRIEHNYSTQSIRELCEKYNIAIAVIYDSWFNGELLPLPPSEWTKICEWNITNNVVCSDSLVSWYAVNPNYTTNLKQNLMEYQQNYLPEDIKVIYYI
ncbi:MAG: hypothetical protein ACTSRZ_15620 [Promethearchaeota archaeon]